jgi:hypothetical protein
MRRFSHGSSSTSCCHERGLVRSHRAQLGHVVDRDVVAAVAGFARSGELEGLPAEQLAHERDRADRRQLGVVDDLPDGGAAVDPVEELVVLVGEQATVEGIEGRDPADALIDVADALDDLGDTAHRLLPYSTRRIFTVSLNITGR